MRIRTGRHVRSRRANAALAVPIAAVLAFGIGGCTDASEADGGSPTPQSATSPHATAPGEQAEVDQPILDGEVFTDPDGRYTATVPSAWHPESSIVDEDMELWTVADTGNGLTPNVTVMTEDVAGFTLKTYLDLSVRNAPTSLPDIGALKSGFVTGPTGLQLAVMEFTSDGFRFLAVMSMGIDGAVVMTLTAPPERFASVLDDAYPYMLTLEATGAV